MQHTRIKLENPTSSEEFSLEGGVTSFLLNPWRVRVYAGRGDSKTMVASGEFEGEDELFSFIDSFIKDLVKREYQVVLYTIDELNIGHLYGFEK